MASELEALSKVPLSSELQQSITSLEAKALATPNDIACHYGTTEALFAKERPDLLLDTFLSDHTRTALRNTDPNPSNLKLAKLHQALGKCAWKLDQKTFIDSLA